MNRVLSRVTRAVADEGASIFVIGYLFSLARYLYADLCLQLDEGRAIWSGRFPHTLPHAIEALPRVDHEWLFEAVAWPFWAHGIFALFALACAAAAAATPLAAREIARRCGATAWTANAIGYITIAGAVTSYAVRPQTFAVLAFAALLYVLLGSLERWWAIPILVAVWANVHGTATLAPAIAAIVAAARIVAGTAPALRGRLVASIPLCAVATLATPLGASLYLGAREYTISARETVDWEPLFLAYPASALVAVLFAYVLISGGVRVSRPNAVAVALLGAFGLLWFEFGRFMPFFDIAAVPALTVALGADGAAQGRRPRRVRRSAKAPGRTTSSALLALPIVLVIGVASWFFAPFSIQPPAIAAAADDLVARTGFAGRAFVPFEAASYLELRQRPVEVLLDSAGAEYPPAVWDDWRTIDAARAGWQNVLERRRIDAAIAADDSATASALATDPGWFRCAESGGWSLYARNGRAARRTPALRCKPWTGASSPTPTPNSTPRSRAKSAGKSTISS